MKLDDLGNTKFRSSGMQWVRGGNAWTLRQPLAKLDFSWAEERPHAPIDYSLLILVVSLTLLGVVMVYASTYHQGLRYFKWQLVRALGGFFVLWIGTKLNVSRLAQVRTRWLLLLGAVLLLGATFFLGEVVGVTKRNIMGVIQPAEFTKFVLLIWLAGYFADLNESKRAPNFINSVVKPGSVSAGMVLLTLLQPAVGTSVIVALSALAVFILVGVRWRYLFLVCLCVGIFVALALLTMPLLRNTKYRYIPERLDKFRAGDRYHQDQALIALGSGGVFGRGLGEGRQKYYFLPKLHKDFIFCAIGEEFGFIGCFITMLFYLLFFLRGMRVSLRTTQPFNQYLAGGITVMIMVYALVHQAVTLSVIPTTGQPLPFISYGGSALIANLLAAGLLLKISKFRRNGAEESINSGRWNRGPHFSGTRSRPGV